MSKNLKAVIMAGGEGARLRPITASRPKPLTPICNRPIMEHILLLLKRQGIDTVVATVHYLAEAIEGYFGDGSEWEMNLYYSHEDTPLGTAGSVKKAEDYLSEGTFVIVSGDALTDIDLQPALDFHRQKGALATLILARVQNPLEFGVVITQEDGRILRFLEKPSWSEVFSDTVNTGMYILEPEIFGFMEPNAPYDFSQDLFPLLMREGKPLYGYVMNEYWSDVGSLQQYRTAQEDLLQRRVNLDIPGVEQQPGIFVGAGAYLDPAAEIIAPSCIGASSKIKSGAVVGPFAVIGENCIIEENAVVARSILWDSVYIGHASSVQSAIVGSRATIKEAVQIQEDAVVGDRCMIDGDSVIRSRIKLWPDKYIESGSTVNMSLIWGKNWRGSLFRNLSVQGLSNIEITPELATKLGAAYGSSLSRGSIVVTSRDSLKVSRMIKRAFISGLLSTGIEVMDLRSMPLPIVRHAIRTTQAVGGVTVRAAPINAKTTLIEFYDQGGIYLSKNQERKVENLYFREDFVRCDPSEVGTIEFASRAIEQYQSGFLSALKHEQTTKPLRLVADFAYSRVASIYPGMLGQFGHDVISLNAYPDPSKAPHSPADVDVFRANLQQIVRSLNADCGVLFENEGERLNVVDEKGRLISGYGLLMTYALLVAKSRPGCSIAAPITAPSSLEELLRPYDAHVIRTKTDARSLMTIAAESADNVALVGDMEGGLLFPEFQPSFDAMFAFARLLEMAQKAELKLSQVYDQVPPSYVASRAIRCPWELKGRIMRVLTEDASREARVELIDGIKIHHDEAWALVLPDSAEPVFHLHVEGPTQKDAEILLNQYAERIEAIR